MSDLDRILVIPDVHRPYHSKKSWNVMLKAAKRFAPNKIIVLGDFLDMFSLSDHDKDPRRMRHFSEEVASGREGLEELENLKPQVKIFQAGNHEYRLDRYLMRKAPELVDFVSVEKALKLKENGWKYQPYMTHGRVGKLYYTHDAGHAGVHAVHHTGQAFNKSIVFGHCHRLAVSYFGSVTGERHFSASLGWLGDEKEAQYLPESKKAAWQHGFGLVRAQKNGNIHIQLVPIVDSRCVLEGQLV